MIRCTGCHRPYPEDSVPYRCPACGGVYDFGELPVYDPARVGAEPGIWRYRHTFGLPSGAPAVYLGEGDTPLVWSSAFGRQVAFKLEFLNPTSSFKDRGTALLVSFLCARGVREAVEDSSGNAGSSFAAYAASAGLRARVFIPAYAAGPKRDQIAAYGAGVIPIPGPRTKASEAVIEAASQGAVYASHAYLPQGLPGFSTVAFELLDQLGTAPGTVIVPAGQGLLILALGRGFRMLREAGLIPRLPRLVGVQAAACAPLWAAATHGEAGLRSVREGKTLAEGVRIRYPLRMEAILETVKASSGGIIRVEEDAILPGQRSLAQLGFFVEPTSAIVWDALAQVVPETPDPLVAILTGSGLKAI